MIDGLLSAWQQVRAIVLALLGLIGLGLWRRKPLPVLLAGGLLTWVAYFFRDPERTPELLDEAAILSPADGKITAIEHLSEGAPWPGAATHIVIFLSLLDVHVQRSPYAAQVAWLEYRPGSFRPAFAHDAERNESNLIVLETARGRLAVRQMVGILARRIVCWVQPGQRLATGQHLGLIRFGSRVDLYLPPQTEVLAQVGQQVYGGQSVLARWT